ncbi:hypothetical protein CSPX01_12225 [Colletotrichum filicis]|nr:hypothetical protein CSPX01_12225 [Colletotrichum filicis]
MLPRLSAPFPLPTVAPVTFSLTAPVVLPAPVIPAIPRDIVPSSVDLPAAPTLPAIPPVNVKGEPINAKVLPLRALPILPINPTTLISLIPAPTGILSCSTVQCIPNYVCKEKNGAPICVPVSPTVPAV